MFLLFNSFPFSRIRRSSLPCRVIFSFLLLFLLREPPGAMGNQDRFVAVPSLGNAPLTVLLNAETVDGGLPALLLRPTWSFGDGTFDGGAATGGVNDRMTSVEHTYDEPGTYLPVFEYSDISGNVHRLTSEVTVLPKREGLTVTVDAASPTASAPFIFDTKVTGGVEPYIYTHHFGDNTPAVTGFLQQVRHIYALPGDYEVTVDVVDRNGNSGQGVVSVTVEPKALNYLAEAAPERGIAPLTVTFSIIRARGVEPYTIVLDPGDESPPVQSSEPFFVHTYTAPGTYEASVEVTDAQGTAGQASLIIEVVTETGVADRVEALSDRELPEIDTLEELDAFMPAVALEFTAVGEDVLGLPASDPLKASAADASLETAERLFDRLVPVVSPILTVETTEAEVKGLVVSAGDISRSLVKSEIALTPGMVKNTRNLSELALGSVLDDILVPAGVDRETVAGLVNDPDKAKTFLKEFGNRKILARLLDAVGIRVEILSEVTREEVAAILAGKGLPASILDTVRGALPDVANMGSAILENESGGKLTLLDFFSASLPGTAEVDPLAGTVINRSPEGELFVQAVTRVWIVPDHIPEGVFTLPDGSMLAVKDNIAINLSPAPLDVASLVTAIKEGGYTPYFLEDGRLVLTGQAPGEQLVFNMGRGLSELNRFLAGAVSFSVPVSDPASEAFNVLISYEEGESQSAVPMIMAKDRLLSILEELVPGLYSLDLETGILDLTPSGNPRFKADILFENLPAVDLEAIQNAGGLVIGDAGFELSDYNGDGVTDVRFNTSDPLGRQILYGLAD